VAAERVRIARELHYVVAHHLRVMAIQAGARRLLHVEPEQTRTALSAIEDAGHDARPAAGAARCRAG
jgi:signal transduction histidine kinase